MNAMIGRVTLVGLDFGTTTSSAVVATASLVRNAVTGRSELMQVRERFRSEMVFTPFADGCLDLGQAEKYLDGWLAAGDVRKGEMFGGGALLTGLTARQENATLLVDLIRRRLGDALIATADDPCLESWLAFVGSCGPLSRAHPDRTFINVDIGGGTTNFALGQNGHVRRTGCLSIGARHVQVVPGTYRIKRRSPDAGLVMLELGIGKGVTDVLTDVEVAALLDFDVELLEAVVRGDRAAFAEPTARLLEQVPFHLPRDMSQPIVTLSGGVGELVYAHLRGEPWPSTTQFGDLGIDLARRVVQSKQLARDLRTYVPAGGGRASVYGLLRHSTEISGSTLYLPRPELLPLSAMPILGSVSNVSTDGDLCDLVERVMRRPRGGCLFVKLTAADVAEVRMLGGRLAAALSRAPFAGQRPLVLLVRENVGKVLGGYVSEWGQLPANLIVVDEVPVRDAHYVHIGCLRQQVVPISFHGLYETGDSPCLD
jgi:ethanolamine utilization protein EutA